MSDPSNVKVGDFLAVRTGYGFCGRDVRLVRVERVTPTQVIAGGVRYRKDSGDVVGSGDSYCRHTARVATEQDMADAAYTRAVAVLRATNWSKLPDEAVLACAEIVKQHTKQDGAA